MKIAIAIFYLLICFSAWANQEWVVTEEKLVSELLATSPDAFQIKEGLKRFEAAKAGTDEKYQWSWVTKASYTDSSETAIATFIPTFGPTYLYQTGLEKKIKGGVAFGTNIFTDQQSTEDKTIDEATRTGFQVSLSVDLWKNLFGRVDRAELKSQNLLLEKSRLESEMSLRSLELEMRKIYWRMVANQEKIKVTSMLLKTSEKQLAEAIDRQKKHIADKGEVARYRAQLANRKATLDSIKFQQEQLIQILKNQLPNVSTHNFKLGSYNVQNKVVEVLQCTTRLQSSEKVPWQNTKLDEILELVEKNYEQQVQIYSNHSDADVQLTTLYQQSGVDKGYSDSFEDFSDNGRSGVQVGFSISVPLGSTSKDTEQAKLMAEKNNFQAEKGRFLAEAQSQHTQLVKLVSFLNSATQRLEENSGALQRSIKVSQQKYKQARISINSLITEQDALFNSQLSEIDTKLQVIHTLLDYFKTFTEDPCTLNKIGV